MKIRQMSPQEYGFTEVLCGIAHMPIMLYLCGDLPSLSGPVVAIVGSRRPSKYGREVAYSLAYELATAECVVVSGMALGIDAIAHRGCLDAGGTTVAVLGTAIDRLYPRANIGLAEEIVRSGGILSEYGPGATTNSGCFAARNRIVSGLSDAVIVVEASSKSGTLITAEYARSQGRKIYAVPGPVDSVLSAGCNGLIRDGARIVTSVAECVAEIAGVNVAPEQPELGLDEMSAPEALAEMTLRELRRPPM